MQIEIFGSATVMKQRTCRSHEYLRASSTFCLGSMNPGTPSPASTAKMTRLFGASQRTFLAGKQKPCRELGLHPLQD